MIGVDDLAAFDGAYIARPQPPWGTPMKSPGEENKAAREVVRRGPRRRVCSPSTATWPWAGASLCGTTRCLGWIAPGGSSCGPAISSSWTTLRWLLQRLRPLEPQASSARQPQEKSRCQTDLPAEIFARPEPDRAGLRQAQTLVAEGRGPHPRSRLRGNRRASRRLHPG